MENLRHYLINWLNDSNRYDPLEELSERDIRVGRDERYPNLFNLKYGTILADKADPLVCACRGAVIERVDNDGDHSPYYRLVAYAFDRFFNVGEANCHKLDWSRTKIHEKADGSLIKLFNYRDEWIVSTSGTVAGASEVGSTGRSYAELFWSVFEQVGYSKEVLDPNLCYIFELCHRDNRIVVDYEEPRIPLLAVRDRTQDFEELDLEEFGLRYGYEIAKSYQFGSMDALMTVTQDLDGNFEGFVLFDGAGRAKIKSSVYCQLHTVRGNGKPDFSKLYINDDLDEFLLHFPEYAREFDVHLRSLEIMSFTVNSMLNDYAHLDQKEFALAVIERCKPLSGACFALRSGKYEGFHHWASRLTPKQLDKLLGIC